MFFSFLFEPIETGYEFAVSTFEGVLGINAIEARGIDEAEEEISEFGFNLVFGSGGYRFMDFGSLLGYLIPYLPGSFPVKAYVGSFFLHAECFYKRGQCCGDAG